MKIVEIEDLNSKIPNAIVTNGTFDGVHIGHQKILSGISRQAAKIGGSSVVLTFWPHPRFVINPNENNLKLLSTFEEKTELIKQSNIDYLVKLRFTKEFSELHSEEFIQQILIDKLGTKKLVIGHDHRFGKNREGGFDFLMENQNRFGFELEEIPRQDVAHVGVSSTRIRNALNAGDVSTAHQYLGRPYNLSGKVEPGDKIGTKMGFPTANIHVEEHFKLIPAEGVYAVLATVNQIQYRGMLNIGTRPTVSNGAKKIEVHILDFSEDIYGEIVNVQFVQRIRDEKKFDGLDELKNQLNRDKRTVSSILSKTD